MNVVDQDQTIYPGFAVKTAYGSFIIKVNFETMNIHTYVHIHYESVLPCIKMLLTLSAHMREGYSSHFVYVSG